MKLRFNITVTSDPVYFFLFSLFKYNIDIDMKINTHN